MSRQRLMVVFQRAADAAKEQSCRAERLLQRAATELAQQRLAPLTSCPTPLRLGSTDQRGVSVLLDTPADVDAAGLLHEVLHHDSSAQWRLRPAPAGTGQRQLLSIALTDGALDVQLEIPHSMDYSKARDEPAKALPRLHAGELRFASPQLTMAQSRLITSSARQAFAGVRNGTDAVGGPLAALDRLLEPIEGYSKETLGAAPAAPAADSGSPPRPTVAAATDDNAAAATRRDDVANRDALAASAANAAAWGQMRPPHGAAAHASAGASASAREARAPALSSPGEALEYLQEHLGARVAMPLAGDDATCAEASWGALAGAAELRLQVEEALLLPLRSPEAFVAVRAGTRALPQQRDRQAALLFYGPPGTGKTTAARIAAQQAGLPLVYAPLEALMSKWLGQGEQQLAALFDSCEALRQPCVLFLDELDALAGSRSREMHEASRRMLSVLLRRLDGIEARGAHGGTAAVTLIAATNRQSDLDSALLSRFDVRVHFPPPEAAARTSIFGLYAKHLPPEQRGALGEAAGGLSGRDILDVCRQAERRWVCMLLRGDVHEPPLPPLEQYEAALRRRQESSHHAAQKSRASPTSTPRRRPRTSSRAH